MSAPEVQNQDKSQGPENSQTQETTGTTTNDIRLKGQQQQDKGSNDQDIQELTPSGSGNGNSNGNGHDRSGEFISGSNSQKGSNEDAKGERGTNGHNSNGHQYGYVHTKQGLEKGYTVDSVAIIGTGPYGQGIAKLCERSGLYYYTKVCFGSSKVTEYKEDIRIGGLRNIPIYPIQEAISQAQIIFLAIPATAEHNFAKNFSSQLEGKYVIEVSNPQKINKKGQKAKEYISQAETLQEQLPGAVVCKSMNNISSHAMLLQTTYSKRNLVTSVATANLDAAATVAKVLQMMGIQADLVPGLWYARQMETKQQGFFTEWWTSVAWFLVTALFVFIYFEIFYAYKPKEGPGADYQGTGYKWKDISFWLPTVFSGDLSMFLYTLCYWPGPMLYCFKWFRGGQEFRIPKFMHAWLAARKYLGLLASYWMIFHTIGLMFMYFMFPREPDEEEYLVEGLESLTQALDMTGIVCLMILAPILVTSLPNQILMWKEWHFVQSVLGQTLMVCATAHTLTVDYSYIMEKRSEWRSAYNPNKLWPAQYFMLIPLFIAMGFIFLRWLLSTISFVCRGNPIAKLTKNNRRQKFAVYVWDI